MTITLDTAPKSEDIAQVRAGLMAFNQAAVGNASFQPLALYVRDDVGAIRGGLVGYLAWSWLSIDLLWLDESLRRQGYGAALLLEAERTAQAAGCVAARLDTYEFQARPFYEHHGYRVYGELEGYPAGTRQYFLMKVL
ncbi:MAG: GNAT family N-acetyltransferase [Gemmatimonadaceae bacterium]